jgi:hypothetical protein
MRNGLVGFLKAGAIALLQFVLANVVTLLLSFPVNMQPEENPLGVAAVLGVTSLVGIAIGGWIGLRVRWLPGDARYLVRILTAVAGITIVLGLALALGQVREASPFLTGSMLAGIAGFHIPGWVRRVPKPTVVTP